VVCPFSFLLTTNFVLIAGAASSRFVASLFYKLKELEEELEKYNDEGENRTGASSRFVASLFYKLKELEEALEKYNNEGENRTGKICLVSL